MSVLIIYHNIKPDLWCSDGIAAAWVASKAFVNYTLLGCCYDEEPPTLPIGTKTVVIVDFSFSNDVLLAWESQGIKIILVEHHEGKLKELFSLSNLSSHIDVNIDIAECGATLAWKRFFPHCPMPVFLEYIRDRDIWTKALPYTEEAHSTISRCSRKGSVEYCLEFFDWLATFNREGFLEFCQIIGSPLVEARKAEIARIIKRQGVSEIVLSGFYLIGNALDSLIFVFYQVPQISLKVSHEQYHSDIGNEIVKQYPEAQFVVIEMADKVKHSLRGDKNKETVFDCSLVAQLFGGNGHKSAAGFSLKSVA